MKQEGHWLFEETVIRNMKLQNRLVRSATGEGMCDADGRPSTALISIYRELARGGAGLIIAGLAFVAPEGKPLPGAMGIHRDDLGADFRELTRLVHEEGGKICLQIGHAGSLSRQPYNSPAALPLADIERLVNDFAAAAGRARKWGFDAVQLQAAHGYLINQFLSPHTNLRTDRYGGTLENRGRFLMEVYGKVRKVVGKAFPVLVKLNGSDYLEGGFGLPDALSVAKTLDVLGVDAIEISGGTPASGEHTPVRKNIDAPNKEAYNLQTAKLIKKTVKCPVIVVGGIRSLWSAKTILARDRIDYLALSRPFICEPDLANRWRVPGELSLSRCKSCNRCIETALQADLKCRGIVATSD